MVSRLKTEDSLNKRYTYKLGTNLIGLAIGAVTLGIVPRGLGPVAYGNFNFLSNFFTQTVGFLEMGTSLCFFTKLSQRQGDHGIVSFYFRFSLLIMMVVTIFLLLARVLGVSGRIWPDQQVSFVFVAALLAFLMWFSQVLGNMSDAYGITTSAEKMKVLQKALGAVAVAALFLSGTLNLATYFSCQLAIVALLIGAFFAVLRKSSPFRGMSWRLDSAATKSYVREFSKYSHPLIVYAFFSSFLPGIADRWLLQVFGGSIQQGFFGLSYQICGVCLIFTTAMTPLLMREFSIAHGRNDLNHMAVLFRRYIPMLFAVAAFFSCFIAVQADKVVALFGGAKYAGAGMAVAIMAFYPMCQTYGQLSGSVFFATGQTGLYRNIGVLFNLIGLPVTYFLIAPAGKFGLDAGAMGLAVKTVGLSFVVVNVQLWFNARLLSLPFRKFVAHQLGTILILVLTAAAVAKCADLLTSSLLVSFVVSGIFYLLGSAGILFLLPSMFSMTRRELLSNVGRCGLYVKQCFA